jgi:glutamine amidotransferase PdxT
MNKDSTTKQLMSYKPSTIETIDTALFEYINEEINCFCTTNKGFKKVPVIWVSSERAFQIKNNKDLRDDDGTLIFPMMTLQRDSFEKSLQEKGIFYGSNLPINDAKGGSITIQRKIKQDKTANFLNADTYRKQNNIVGNQGFNGTQQINFPNRKKANEKKIVYETITIPAPVYVNVNYTIQVRTEYQQQMNEIVQPFVTNTSGINYKVLGKDGHTYEVFFAQDFSVSNNLTELGDEARVYETNIGIRVLGYLVGAAQNEKQPNIVVRENAVEVKTTRERVMFGDEPDWIKGKYRP